MDIASLIIGALGVFISLGGFSAAIWQIRRTRTAAESAERAATDAREAVLRTTSISYLTQAVSQIERLKELHRNQDLDRVVERYTPLRQILTATQARLSASAIEELDNAIIELMRMERDINRAIFAGNRIDHARFIGILLNIQQVLDEARVYQERQMYGASDIGSVSDDNG